MSFLKIHKIGFVAMAGMLLSTSAFAISVKSPSEIYVCSFNIQFLGFYAMRDNDGLAELMKKKECDIVVIQELVAPPSPEFLAKNHPAFYQFPLMTQEQYDLWTSTERGKRKKGDFPFVDKTTGKPTGLRVFPESVLRDSDTGAALTWPDGKPMIVNEPIDFDIESTAFFEAMARQGFTDFVLSDQDTGAVAFNHSNNTDTEWYVTFYNPKKVEVAPDLISDPAAKSRGYLSTFTDNRLVGKYTEDPIKSPKAEGRPGPRAPHAFPFRVVKSKKAGGFDFVLISVHLEPGSAGHAVRGQEIAAIKKWTEKQSDQTGEKDYMILGDMNIESAAEMVGKWDKKGKLVTTKVLPDGWTTLNLNASYNSNSNPYEPRPYDHVMFNRDNVSEKFELPESFYTEAQLKKLGLPLSVDVPDPANPGSTVKIENPLLTNNYEVINLGEEMRYRWPSNRLDDDEIYPWDYLINALTKGTYVKDAKAKIYRRIPKEAKEGDKETFYTAPDAFRMTFSDHFPVRFKVFATTKKSDDDSSKDLGKLD